MSRPNSQTTPPPSPELEEIAIAVYDVTKQARCIMASHILAGLMANKHYAKFELNDLTRMALDHVDKIVKLA